MIASHGPPSPAPAPHCPSGSRAIVSLLLACWIGACGSGAEGPARSAPEGAPNVLFVTVDTLRADHLGCYGYERPTSPNLDALAEEGVLFERAYVHAPFTAPSHGSLLTSLLPVSHGLRTWGMSLDPEARTLGERLSARGWRTAAIHNHPGLRDTQLTRGFDAVREQYFFPAEDTVDWLLEWLDAGEGPFGAWVHLWDVHRPYGYRDWSADWLEEVDRRAPSPFAFAEERFGPAPDGDIGIGRTEGYYNLNAERRGRPLGTARGKRTLDAQDLSYLEDRYDGGVAWADRGVRRLLAGLRERGLYDDTLIVITSDHGESLREREACYFTHDPFLFEETLHVPLLLRLPGGAHAGTRVETLARGIDVLPTILEVLDIAPILQGRFRDQGRSLMPAVRGEPQRPSTLYAGTLTKSAKETVAKADDLGVEWLEHREALFDGRWKLIEDLGAATLQLYDVELDPAEARGPGSRPRAGRAPGRPAGPAPHPAREPAAQRPGAPGHDPGQGERAPVDGVPGRGLRRPNGSAERFHTVPDGTV